MQIIFGVRVTAEWANVKILAKGYWSDKIQWGYEIFVSESVYMRIFKSDSHIVLRLRFWLKIFVIWMIIWEIKKYRPRAGISRKTL